MKVALVSLSSTIHEERKIDETLSPYRDVLEENFQVTELEPEELDSASLGPYDLTAVFVKTGGTEQDFKEIYRDLPQPVYLIATPLHNSLPASLEILSWVKSEYGRGRIIHGDPEDVVEQLRQLANVATTGSVIFSSRLGVIGQPSDWLIASDVDYEKVKERWGLEIVDVDLDELYSRRDKVSPASVGEKADEITVAATGTVENSREDTVQAMRIYFALRELADDYELSALTLRCFDLVTELQTTGCLGLALLNDEGIVAGCEGDVPAAFSMMVGYHLTGQVPFMANPVEIDEEKDRVVLAHCTVPKSMTDDYALRSHFESGIGVGIQGTIPQGPITLAKIGGNNLDKYFVAEGRLTENLTRSTACRTQIVVQFESDVAEYLLTKPLANHHVVIPGNHRSEIEELMDCPD